MQGNGFDTLDGESTMGGQPGGQVLSGRYTIVRLQTFQSDEAIKYLVMEYVDGGSLEDRISSQGPMSVEAAMKIFSQVAAGLDLAHSQGVLHRDIKPANIMLTKDGTAKLPAFGIARELKD